MAALTIAFVHRHNQDGTHDSICSACLATVGSTQNEVELHPMSEHISAIPCGLIGRVKATA